MKKNTYLIYLKFQFLISVILNFSINNITCARIMAVIIKKLNNKGIGGDFTLRLESLTVCQVRNQNKLKRCKNKCLQRFLFLN
jgi:hypothetical protein